MTLFARRPWTRWFVPVLVALALTAGVSGITALTANAGDKLAPRTAAQLLVDAQQARVQGLSGTIVQNADLGLPSLPGVGGTGSSDLSSMVSGSHTLRFWYAGPNRVRLSLLGSLGESDVVRNGHDLWIWSSKDKTASHRTVPLGKQPAPSIASGSPVTPQQAAQQALKAITPSTSVSTVGTSTVAGRSAYELLLRPRDSGSLVGSVRIAIDGKTHVPTRVQVFARGSRAPAFEVAFTQFDPSTPDASLFRFNPPPDTKVTESGSGPSTGSSPRTAPKLHQGAPSGSHTTHVVGTGWTSVLVTDAPTGKAGGATAGSGSLATALGALPKVSGAWGSGHLLQGTLFSALLTDNGKLVVGAVPPEKLYAALGR